MCELLQRGNTSKSTSTALKEQEKIILINFIISVLKHLSESPKYKNKLINITSVIMIKLPNLLIYYNKDTEALRELVKIPYYFNLNSLASSDLKSSFLETLEHFKSIFFKSNDEQIILKTGSTLVKFASISHPLQKEAKSELIKIIDTLISIKNSNYIRQIDSIMRCKDISEEIGKDYFEVCYQKIKEYPSHVLGLVYY